MYIPKITFAKLLHAKMFLGGARRMWNPEIVGYLSGIRNRTSILDLTQTSFGLKKFLGFVELTSLRRGRTLIILRPAFAPLAELIYPMADYFPRYIGGALSNLSFTCYHANIKNKRQHKGKTFVRYPSAAVLFGDHSRRVDFMVNETLCTRTPSALLCDATTFSSAIPYHIPTSSDFTVARLMTHHVISAIRRGKRHEKLSLRRVFRSLVKSAVKKYLKVPVNIYPHIVTKSLKSSAFFGADPLRRLSLLNFYYGHRLHFFRPKTFKDETYIQKIKHLIFNQRSLNINHMVKPILVIRKSLVLVRMLTNILLTNRTIPIFGSKPSELVFSGARLKARREMKRLAKQESRMVRTTAHYAHGNIKRRANLIKNPFRKRLLKKLKAKAILTSKKKRKKRNNLLAFAHSKPELAIRILGESIQGIKSKHTLNKIWTKLEAYPRLRRRLFKGRVHNLIQHSK